MNYYEINVSFGGKHLFATAERSITSEEQAYKIYRLLKDKLGPQYELMVTKYETVGHIVNANE